LFSFLFKILAKRTQSLLDLRYVFASPSMPQKQQHTHVTSTDETDHKNNTKNKLNNDHIYNTIRSNKSTKSLGRNCVSLENLCAITRTFKNDLNQYNSNLMHHNNGKFIPAPDSWGYNPGGVGYAVPMAAAAPYHYYYQQYPIQFYNYPMPPFDGYNFYNVNYNNPYINTSSNNNSRQSLGNASDDFRKYRDVAL
jgi:hypothetical protein